VHDRVQALADVFGADLAADARFLERLDRWHRRLAAATPAEVVSSVGQGG
jgi:hypothetical protein